MKNMKPLVAAVAVAAASFASAPVLAQIQSTQALNVIDNTAFYGDTFEMEDAGKSFTDRFTFTVNETIPQTLNAIVASISNQPSTGLDITGLSLYDSTDALLSSGIARNGGRIDVWTLSDNTLQNGQYVMEVRGNVL
ncbi:MAG TPA: FxDxF family PEP-CTERM protein, partial [Telluria sp.]